MSKSRITKAIIPAAGLGTRFFPIAKSIPKEMLPIVDKPCIQYLVEEAVQSGIKEIIFIISDDKESIKDYFSPKPALIKELKKRKKLQIAKSLQKIEKLAKFKFVKQDKQLGDGHAILCAKHLIKNEPFAVLFADDIYDSKPPALKQLITQYKKHLSPIIALQKVPKSETNKYGIIGIESKKDRLYQIKNLIEKPSPSKAPSNLAITGKYIVTPQLLKDLEKARPSKDTEIRLIDGMREFINHSPIYGYDVKGLRFDTGDKNGYLKAVKHFSKK